MMIHAIDHLDAETPGDEASLNRSGSTHSHKPRSPRLRKLDELPDQRSTSRFR